MTRRAAIGLRADRDVTKAFEWYERERPGLGGEFVAAFRETVELLEHMSELGHLVHGDLRRFSVRGFPYAIYYRITRSNIRIRACLHERREARVRETPQMPTRAQLPDAQAVRAQRG